MEKKRIVSLDEWIRDVESETLPNSLLPMFIPSDAIILISGKAKQSFKSWWIFLTSLSIASGKPTSLFSPFCKSPVWIIEEEGARKPTASRFKMLEKGSGINVEKDCKDTLFWSHRNHFLVDDERNLREICASVKAFGIKLLVLDTLAKTCRADENKADDIGEVMRKLDVIRDCGCSVCYIHHIKKLTKDASQDIDDEIRGSSAIDGFYDTHLAFRRRDPSQRHISLTVRSRDDEEKYFNVHWDINKDRGSAVLNCTETNPNEVNTNALNSLQTSMLEGHAYSKKAIQNILEVPKEQFEKLLIIALDSGILYECDNKFLLNNKQVKEEL